MPYVPAVIESSNTEPHKLLGLDHLRAFAITFVVLFHYQFFGHPAWVNKTGSFGWTGVDLFFVLSGFLISGQLFAAIAKGGAISIREFFLKRFFRIIPPYLLVLALYFLFPVVHEWGHLPSIWRYLTFTLNFGFDLSKFGTFSHAWSLCVEEQFYLILPLTFLLFSYFKGGKRTAYLIFVLFIAGFITRFLSWHYLAGPYQSTDSFGIRWNEYIYYPTYNRLDALLTGVSIAGLFTFYPNIKTYANKHSNIVLLTGLILLAFAYWMCTPQDNFYTCVFGFPIIAIGYGLLLAAVVCPSNRLYQLKSWVTSQIATLSYAIYLVHKIMIHLTQMLLGKLIDKDSNLMMIACLMASILGALIIRYTIEKPALKMRNRILANWKQKRKLPESAGIEKQGIELK